MRPDTVSAIRARLIEAMERRAAGLDGAARRVLDARLDALRALDGAAPDETPDTRVTPAPPGPLRQLVDHLESRASPERAAYPDLPALADSRHLWSALLADSQLRQFVAHAPADAGPLNSAALANRAITLMREVSPEYLRPFLAYVDELAWLGGAGCATTSGVAATKKRVRRK